MGTCKTCKWWDRGQCEQVNVIDPYNERPSISPTRFEIQVTVADDYNLEVRFHTGPDFGCIHHCDK